MSCLSLRFPPARKAWKNFTTKLQSKLRKLHNSKAIKKPPRTRVNATTPADFTASDFLKQRLNRKKKSKQRLHFRKLIVKKKPAPVYIDKLFKDAGSGMVLESAVVASRVKKTKSSVIMKNNDDHSVLPSALPESSQHFGTGEEIIPGAGDAMWESVGLASPLMNGIDERAEEFIARFRAEMKYQERQARNL